MAIRRRRLVSADGFPPEGDAPGYTEPDGK
jgi:hypothetical protein